jgi:lipocalin
MAGTTRRLITAALAPLAVSALFGCASDSRPLALAPSVDLDRYSGRWYIIAGIPYFPEKGNVVSYFDISFRGDKLTDVYTAHPKDFSAPTKSYTLTGYVVPDTGNTRWRKARFGRSSCPT